MASRGIRCASSFVSRVRVPAARRSAECARSPAYRKPRPSAPSNLTKPRCTVLALDQGYRLALSKIAKLVAPCQAQIAQGSDEVTEKHGESRRRQGTRSLRRPRSPAHPAPCGEGAFLRPVAHRGAGPPWVSPESRYAVSVAPSPRAARLSAFGKVSRGAAGAAALPGNPPRPQGACRRASEGARTVRRDVRGIARHERCRARGRSCGRGSEARREVVRG